MSQEGVDSIKKDTSELHDQGSKKSEYYSKKMRLLLFYKIHKFEARQSNRNQGTDSRNRTTNMENQGMTKEICRKVLSKPLHPKQKIVQIQILDCEKKWSQQALE